MRHQRPKRTQLDNQKWPIKLYHLMAINETYHKIQSKHGKIVLSECSVEQNQIYQYTYGENSFPMKRNNCYCWENYEKILKYQPMRIYMDTTTTVHHHFYLLEWKHSSTRNQNVSKQFRTLKKGIRTRHIVWGLSILEPMGKQNTRTKSIRDCVFQTQIHKKNQPSLHILFWAMGERNLVFYANNGRIEGQYHKWLQEYFTVTVAMFLRMGLKTNLE